MVLEWLVCPSVVEEARLLLKEAEGVEIQQGIEVGVVKYLLTLLEAVAHRLRGQVAVGVLLIDLWMELVELKKASSCIKLNLSLLGI